MEPKQQHSDPKLPKAGKYKSVLEANVKGAEESSDWKQPLRRHINPNTNAVEFITIQVRVLSGDSEHDFQARFSPITLTASLVCQAIAEKELLDPSEAELFSLWVVSKDLELQVRPDDDIFGLMIFWNRWVLKYTHFPEAQDPRHHVNHNWFVYRRKAGTTIEEERKLANTRAATLLFGEAKRNFLTKRYVCSQLEAATIAGMQLQIAYGDHNPDKHRPGYLAQTERLQQLLPIGMSEKLRAQQWEEIITVQYKTFLGMDVDQVRSAFLDFARTLPCYGSCLFPVCGELPPSNFFEYRTQNWFVGVGPNGVVIMDFDILKYVQVLPWTDLSWKAGADQLIFSTVKNGKPKEIYLITPQSHLIANMCRKSKYKWAKETGLLKPKDSHAPIQKTQPTAPKPINAKSGSKGMISKSMDRLAKALSKSIDMVNSSSNVDLAVQEPEEVVSNDAIGPYVSDSVLPANYKPVEETIIGSKAYNEKRKDKQKKNRAARVGNSTDELGDSKRKSKMIGKSPDVTSPSTKDKRKSRMPESAGSKAPSDLNGKTPTSGKFSGKIDEAKSPIAAKVLSDHSASPSKSSFAEHSSPLKASFADQPLPQMPTGLLDQDLPAKVIVQPQIAKPSAIIEESYVEPFRPKLITEEPKRVQQQSSTPNLIGKVGVKAEQHQPVPPETSNSNVSPRHGKRNFLPTPIQIENEEAELGIATKPAAVLFLPRPVENQQQNAVEPLLPKPVQVTTPKQQETNRQELKKKGGISAFAPAERQTSRKRLPITEQEQSMLDQLDQAMQQSKTPPHPHTNHARASTMAVIFTETTHNRSSSTPTGDLGTHVKVQKQVVEKSKINKRSSQMYNLDSHIGGVKAVEVIDKRDILKETDE